MLAADVQQFYCFEVLSEMFNQRIVVDFSG